MEDCWIGVYFYDLRTKKWLDFRNEYQVNENGIIKSLARKTNNQFGKEDYIISQQYSGGYNRVLLCKKGIHRYFQVNRIVAFAFPNICGEWFEGAVAHHKNENKIDNRAENIEWVTKQYNTTFGNGYLSKFGKLINDPKRSKQVCQYDKNGVFLKKYPSTMEAERQTGIRHDNIISCCKHRKHYNTAGGYIWRYEKEVDD